MTISNYLSIWEIAHRWHDVSPDETNPEQLPLNIQDSIRYICQAGLGGGVRLIQQGVSEIQDKRRHGLDSEVKYFLISDTPPEIVLALSRKYNVSDPSTPVTVIG